MKTTLHLLFYLSLFLLFFSCKSKNKIDERDEITNKIITIDVSREYPAKKLVLQDIADVDYIPLETADDFLWQGSISAFSDRFIINSQYSTGNILFFDRSGKGIKRINRQGSSGEEYSPYSNFLFDEEEEELYLNDRDKKKIFVYDLDGTFKRALDYAFEKRYEDMQILDSDRLIAYNKQYKDEEPNSYLIFSKLTGEIEKEFRIHQTGEKITERQTVRNGENVMIYSLRAFPIMATPSGCILNDLSNDTIFYMDQSQELKPLTIQQPSRQTMDPVSFLFQGLECSDYVFYQCIEKKFNNIESGQLGKIKVNSWDLVYDKKEQKLYKQEIQNKDFTSDKNIVIDPQLTQFSSTDPKTYLKLLNAADLVEAYENNQLDGKLKGIASKLDEEDNPVLMIALFK